MGSETGMVLTVKFQFSTFQGQSGRTLQYINIMALVQYYQPGMIYLISGGVNRSLDKHRLYQLWLVMLPGP